MYDCVTIITVFIFVKRSTNSFKNNRCSVVKTFLRLQIHRSLIMLSIRITKLVALSTPSNLEVRTGGGGIAKWTSFAHIVNPHTRTLNPSSSATATLHRVSTKIGFTVNELGPSENGFTPKRDVNSNYVDYTRCNFIWGLVSEFFLLRLG